MPGSRIYFGNVGAGSSAIPKGVDERKIYTFDYTESGLKFLENLLADTRIVTAQIKVITPFNGVAPTITVGTQATPDKYIAIGDCDLTTIGEYETNPYDFFALAADINATLSLGGSTQGEGIIIIELDDFAITNSVKFMTPGSPGQFNTLSSGSDVTGPFYAQTFLATQSFQANQLGMVVGLNGPAFTGGTYQFDIRGTDSFGKPLSGALASTPNTAITTLPLSQSLQFMNLSVPVPINTGTVYAIVLRAAFFVTDGGNMALSGDLNPLTYSNGKNYSSADGVTWVEQNRDFLFNIRQV